MALFFLEEEDALILRQRVCMVVKDLCTHVPFSCSDDSGPMPDAYANSCSCFTVANAVERGRPVDSTAGAQSAEVSEGKKTGST